MPLRAHEHLFDGAARDRLEAQAPGGGDRFHLADRRRGLKIQIQRMRGVLDELDDLLPLRLGRAVAEHHLHECAAARRAGSRGARSTSRGPSRTVA